MLTFILTALLAFDTLADHPVSFPETKYYGMSNFYISFPDGSDTREVILNVYLSPMGSTFKSRPPTASELQEIRKVCRYMVDLLQSTAVGEPDDYFIEFADGLAPLEQIHPSQRSVFGFTREEGCDAAPEMIGIK